MAPQSLDIKQRPPPLPRRPASARQRWRSPSSSTFPPASAARPARSRAWSGTTCATRWATPRRVYDNPMDLSRKLRTVMRSPEVGTERQAEMADPMDGCMHCSTRLLRVCPAPGAIIQYSNGIIVSTRKTASAAATASPVAPTSRISKKDARLIQAPRARPTAAVNQAACARFTDRGHPVWQQGGHEGPRRASDRRSFRERVSTRPGCSRSGRGRWHPCDVRAAPRRPAQPVRRSAGQSVDQPAGVPVKVRANPAGFWPGVAL